MQNELLTPTELADRLKVSRATVTKWRRANMIPCIRISAAVVRFDFGDVVVALKQRDAQAVAK